MKVALLTDGIYPYVLGGIQKHSYYLAKYLARQKVYVDLYHTGPKEADVADLNGFTGDELSYITTIFIPFPSLGKFPGHYIAEYYKYSTYLYSALISNEPVDFIYAQGFTGWKVAQEKKRSKMLPLMGVNFHGVEMFQQAPNFYVKLQHQLLRLPVKSISKNTDYIFSLGGKLNAIQHKLTDKPIIEIPIGIEKAWISSLDFSSKNKIRKLIFIGRYERRKGIEELLEVLKQLILTYEFEFVFIGPIPEEKKIYSDQIKYLGLIKDEEKVKAALQSADILVCPSYSEGMPTVILEAMACGLAVIATDVGAVNKLISTETGWLITQGSVLALKESITSALTISENELIRLKINAQQLIIKNYTWNNIIERTISVIKNLI
ncbi:glycosyltransferase family 4 protein [Pontibacter harenae]|uniref:glycosyltransferase family 4 protein n=1 Tax=Pontibacter harenae TaxID=2894083 RepID=UPI001E44BB98|nr:glycosyltransferase family 4 protein [Pontibacter harenae]MCC9168226.1 glycosyltransferase family 4 protein [Pontibacter harenae]